MTLPTLSSSTKILIGPLSGVFVGIFFGEDAAMLQIAARRYLDETVAFVVKDHLRDQFSTWAGIRELGAFRVAIPNLPY